ncbi:transglycosylase SLT domain-containing protein [Motilimonas eburnea]|uniref:transglycosylase SLT domain-containing protein n=1 Tax=Motilimonas eburnea TaxID=1737488 RepID=UPI001E2AE152|nr:transglycosylase SLT domain-containing protein [Motilimonas eburnea]MCE2573836.1 transglycosylase SLT domain-containing protein [Motilimonas eburnea]
MKAIHILLRNNGIKALVILLSISLKAQASPYTIPKLYEEVARKHQVPASLLLAISYQESVLKLQSGKVTPWPWTINHRGKPYRFKSLTDAAQACEKLHQAKDYMFDVGLGQVNWRWHRQRFGADCYQAFIPTVNINKSAEILKEERQRSKSWLEAAGRYHHPSNKTFANRYRKGVYRHWVSIQKQLQAQQVQTK